MKLTKETLAKMVREEISEMSSRWRQPGNAPPGTFKKPPKRYPKQKLEPMPETTPEEDRAAQDSFMRKVQFNMIKNMVRGGGADMIDLSKAEPFLIDYGDEGVALLDRIKAARGL
jgi:hypothetical protein